MLRARTRGTADIPAFGTTTDNFAGSIATGLNFYTDITDKEGKFSFFLDLNFNYIWGTSDFSKNLSISHNNADFTQLTIGTQFLENFKISLIVLSLSDEKSLRNKNMTIGGQLIRNK